MSDLPHEDDNGQFPFQSLASNAMTVSGSQSHLRRPCPWRAAVFCLALASPSAFALPDATLTVIGDADAVVLGQDGYCGARSDLPRESWRRIVLKGDEQVWFLAKSTARTADRRHICNAEYTFIAAAGTAYILRMTHRPRDCLSELFRVVPGGDPKRVAMVAPASQSCLFK